MSARSYDVVVSGRAGTERTYPWAAEEQLQPGSVVHVGGRDWLVHELDLTGERPRALARIARYRLRMVYPDGNEELGGFRRYRPEGPTLGHAFTTMLEGQPISWEVVDERLAFDDGGEPFLDLVAERDYGEAEGDLPDHGLEHALARLDELPEAAQAMLAGAEREGLAVELAALDPGEAPDLEEAGRYIQALTLATIEDDLLEQCGVDTRADAEETWLETVKTRLLDSGALGAAGFSRVRKAEIS